MDGDTRRLVAALCVLASVAWAVVAVATLFQPRRARCLLPAQLVLVAAWAGSAFVYCRHMLLTGD